MAITQKVIGNRVSVSGSLKTEKELLAQDLLVCGSVNSNALLTKQVTVTGSLSVETSMTVEQLKVSGWLKVGRNINAEQVKLTGCLTCDGLINAEERELESMSGSNVKEIGAAKVKVIRYQRTHPINQMFSSLIQIVAGPFLPSKN